jgi:hypothetical protein
MRFRDLRSAILTVTVVLGISLLAIAQQPGKQGAMTMGEMMKSCQEHCRMTSASIDNMNKTIDEAKRSNDPAKMRQALDEVQKPLASMKEHMNMCMNMMGMMQKMHGGEPDKQPAGKK